MESSNAVIDVEDATGTAGEDPFGLSDVERRGGRIPCGRPTATNSGEAGGSRVLLGRLSTADPRTWGTDCRAGDRLIACGPLAYPVAWLSSNVSRTSPAASTVVPSILLESAVTYRK